MEELISDALRASERGVRMHLAEQIARKGRRGFLRGRELLFADTPEERQLGAEILGRLDPRDTDLCALAVAELTSSLLQPDPPTARFAALSIAMLPVRDVVERLMMLRYDDRDGVRLALAITLAQDPTEGAKKGLVAMASDANAEVRSWAVFSLAQAELTDAEVLDALHEAAHDEAPHVRGEALLGLARAADDRARSLIREELARDVKGSWVAEAAYHMPDPEYAEGLARHLAIMTPAQRALWEIDYRDAVEACEAAE